MLKKGLFFCLLICLGCIPFPTGRTAVRPKPLPDPFPDMIFGHIAVPEFYDLSGLGKPAGSDETEGRQIVFMGKPSEFRFARSMTFAYSLDQYKQSHFCDNCEILLHSPWPHQ